MSVQKKEFLALRLKKNLLSNNQHFFNRCIIFIVNMKNFLFRRKKKKEKKEKKIEKM